MNPLEQLKDIHLPAAIPWWYPQTWVWYLSFIVFGLVVVYLLWRYFKYRHINMQIQALFSFPKEQRPLQIMMLIKATAIRHAPKVANRLQGEEWVAWLQQHNIKLSEAWQHWLASGYLTNQAPPKDWYKEVPRWLKKLT